MSNETPLEPYQVLNKMEAHHEAFERFAERRLDDVALWFHLEQLQHDLQDLKQAILLYQLDQSVNARARQLCEKLEGLNHED